MFSRFFIYRPIFASVIAIVFSLLGILAIPLLSIESMPSITPPTVSVSTSYPGASAAVVAQSVTALLEEKINGVEGMIYMSSKSASDGSCNITVTFDVGTDIDMATVLVQNRVSKAEPTLPEDVKKQGITVEKKSTDMVMMVNMVSPEGTYDELFISNYATTRIRDVLSRVPGISDVKIFGAKDFGMRIWLDPNRLRARGLTTLDMIQALREQNVQVAAGQVGGSPAPTDQPFEYSISTLGRLESAEQFESIVIKRGDAGSLVHVSDVARVELGAQSYNWYAQLDGAPSIAMGIFQLPGANALKVANGVKTAMAVLAEDFPDDFEHVILYDTTEYIVQSIKEVITTLLVAMFLVVLTVYIFLQDLRTTLVPAITIPVSLLATLGVMLALGMSINALTMFGLVLVIGIVVDDAIVVVVENTLRIIDTEGLDAKAATAKSMLEITGPVVATTLVLLAVFVPTIVMPGISGQLYRPFAITISVATVFFLDQRADPQPGPVRDVAATVQEESTWALRPVQPSDRSRYRGLHGRRARPAAQVCADHIVFRRLACSDLLRSHLAAHRLRTARGRRDGPGGDAAAGRFLAGADGEGDGQGRRDSSGHAGGAG